MLSEKIVAAIAALPYQSDAKWEVAASLDPNPDQEPSAQSGFFASAPAASNASANGTDTEPLPVSSSSDAGSNLHGSNRGYVREHAQEAGGIVTVHELIAEQQRVFSLPI